MTESAVFKIVVGLIGTVLVLALGWTMGSVFALSNNDSAQNAKIQTGHYVDIEMKSELRIHGERLTGLEATDAGITALLGTVVKNQDRILVILDGR